MNDEPNNTTAINYNDKQQHDTIDMTTTDTTDTTTNSTNTNHNNTRPRNLTHGYTRYNHTTTQLGSSHLSPEMLSTTTTASMGSTHQSSQSLDLPKTGTHPQNPQDNWMSASGLSVVIDPLHCHQQSVGGERWEVMSPSQEPPRTKIAGRSSSAPGPTRGWVRQEDERTGGFRVRWHETTRAYSEPGRLKGHHSGVPRLYPAEKAEPHGQRCKEGCRASSASLVVATDSADRALIFFPQRTSTLNFSLAGSPSMIQKVERPDKMTEEAASSALYGYGESREAGCPQHTRSHPSIRGPGGRGGDSQNASPRTGRFRCRPPGVAAKPLGRAYCCMPLPACRSSSCICTASSSSSDNNHYHDREHRKEGGGEQEGQPGEDGADNFKLLYEYQMEPGKSTKSANSSPLCTRNSAGPPKTNPGPSNFLGFRNRAPPPALTMPKRTPEDKSGNTSRKQRHMQWFGGQMWDNDKIGPREPRMDIQRVLALGKLETSTSDMGAQFTLSDEGRMLETSASDLGASRRLPARVNSASKTDARKVHFGNCSEVDTVEEMDREREHNIVHCAGMEVGHIFTKHYKNSGAKARWSFGSTKLDVPDIDGCETVLRNGHCAGLEVDHMFTKHYKNSAARARWPFGSTQLDVPDIDGCETHMKIRDEDDRMNSGVKSHKTKHNSGDRKKSHRIGMRRCPKGEKCDDYQCIYAHNRKRFGEFWSAHAITYWLQEWRILHCSKWAINSKPRREGGHPNDAGRDHQGHAL